MKKFFWKLWLLCLVLPADAELRVDDSGAVTLNYQARQPQVNFVALQGRDQTGEGWHPLATWTLTPGREVRLETGPGCSHLEYRLLLFGPNGFISAEPIAPAGSG